MSTLVKWTLIILAILAAIAAWYFLWYLPSQGSDDSTTTSGPKDGDRCDLTPGPGLPSRPGILQNGVCVPIPSNRMTAISASSVVDNYAVKDSLGYPTINFNGDFTKPNLAAFPGPSLQSLLKNGWWIGLLNGGTGPGGFQLGDNNQYLVGIYDLRDPSASINTGKSQVVIPASLQPYINA